MARKLNLFETQAFSEAILTEQQSDAEMVLRNLMDKRDEALELSPESSFWFGDFIPGAFGFKQ